MRRETYNLMFHVLEHMFLYTKKPRNCVSCGCRVCEAVRSKFLRVKGRVQIACLPAAPAAAALCGDGGVPLVFLPCLAENTWNMKKKKNKEM